MAPAPPSLNCFYFIMREALEFPCQYLLFRYLLWLSHRDTTFWIKSIFRRGMILYEAYPPSRCTLIRKTPDSVKPTLLRTTYYVLIEGNLEFRLEPLPFFIPAIFLEWRNHLRSHNDEIPPTRSAFTYGPSSWVFEFYSCEKNGRE